MVLFYIIGYCDMRALSRIVVLLLFCLLDGCNGGTAGSSNLSANSNSVEREDSSSAGNHAKNSYLSSEMSTSVTGESASKLVFGSGVKVLDVTQGYNGVLELINAGNAPAVIDSIQFPQNVTTALGANQCSTTTGTNRLLANASCMIHYSVSSNNGDGNIEVSYHLTPGEIKNITQNIIWYDPTIDIPLLKISTDQSVLALKQNKSLITKLTLTNVGGRDLISAPTIQFENLDGGQAAAYVESSTCSSGLQPGSACDIKLSLLDNQVEENKNLKIKLGFDYKNSDQQTVAYSRTLIIPYNTISVCDTFAYLPSKTAGKIEQFCENTGTGDFIALPTFTPMAAVQHLAVVSDANYAYGYNENSGQILNFVIGSSSESLGWLSKNTRIASSTLTPVVNIIPLAKTIVNGNYNQQFWGVESFNGSVYFHNSGSLISANDGGYRFFTEFSLGNIKNNIISPLVSITNTNSPNVFVGSGTYIAGRYFSMNSSVSSNSLGNDLNLSTKLGSGTIGNLVVTPNGKYLYVSYCKIGLTNCSLYMYAFTAVTNGYWFPNNAAPSQSVVLSSNPSSLFFDSTGKYLFAQFENEINVYVMDSAGKLSLFATQPLTSPVGKITLDPDGKYLYALNQGESSLSVYAFESGNLSFKRKIVTQYLPTDIVFKKML